MGNTVSVTRLLHDWRDNRTQAIDKLMEQIYQELSRKASYMMRGERINHTLQTHGLVHETYLRLTALREIEWRDREHFFTVVSATMRRILVDHARARAALRRQCNAIDITLDNVGDKSFDMADVLALDKALEKLANEDPMQSRIVELRYFIGLSISETATSLGVSPASVKRKWSLAQAWLYRELQQTVS